VLWKGEKEREGAWKGESQRGGVDVWEGEREREGAWKECTSFPHCSMELPFTQNIWDSIVA